MTAKPEGKATPKPREVVITMTEDGAMQDMGGSKYGVFNHYLANSLMRTMWVVGGENPADREALESKAMGAAVAAMRAFEPKDEIEGLLAAQSLAMHFASMECFRRSIISEQSADTASKLRRDGANLSRGMTDMLSALAKHRGQGQQKVTVEHVHVHAGGQAVVGAVTAGAALPMSGGAVPALSQGDAAMAVDTAVLVEVATRGGGGSNEG